MKPPTKRGAVLPPRKTATAASSKLSKVTPQREIVQHLQRVLAEVDRLPVLTGELGCQALDCFELVDKVRARYREKARKLLLEQPSAIPNWHCSETPQRRLSPDTGKVFDALSGSFLIDMEEFLAACSTSLTAVRNLLAKHNPHLSPDELEHKLNRALVDLISYDSIIRLSSIIVVALGQFEGSIRRRPMPTAEATAEMYRTSTILAGMVNVPRASVFLRDKLFSKVVTAPTDQVDVSFYKGKAKLAPYCSRFSAGIASPRERQQLRLSVRRTSRRFAR